MNGFIAFAEVTGAILASLGVALAIEWYGLNGLMRLLPASRAGSAFRSTSSSEPEKLS